MLNQIENEARMFNGGIHRSERNIEKAESGGRAATSPYAKGILDEFVLPAIDFIKEALRTKGPGRRAAHVELLADLPADSIAVLAVRTAINEVMSAVTTGKTYRGQVTGAKHRAVGYAIGRTVHNELVLAQIEAFCPELYYTLSNDFGRRLSKDEKHRMTVFKLQARNNGIPVSEWPVGSRDQVGLWLLDMLEQLGMLTIEEVEMRMGKEMPRMVSLSEDLMDRINNTKEFLAITMPVYGPCVAPPRDWTTPYNGGYHTPDMIRAHRHVVHHRMARNPRMRDAPMTIPLAAINALQRTAWQVNERVLDTVLKCANIFSVGEVPSAQQDPKPAELSWLKDSDPDRNRWPAGRMEEFVTWKHGMNTWYTNRKLNAIKFARFYSATRAAEMFRGYESIYFVYFADGRGRLYPMTYGMNPQGSDLQKALIQFAEGKPVTTPDAIKWFKMQGANKWGYDKDTFDGRCKWVDDREDLILSFADSPLDNTGWKDASKPLQFLAWCYEFRDWKTDPKFLSKLPISMDGSCNGLQNLSAMFRDEVGGEATNLTPNTEMQDIYSKVAKAAMMRMESMGPLEDASLEAIRMKWVEHGINRSVVKRAVMTTPYGVTKMTATDYVISDYLAEGKAPLFEKSEYKMAARVLMDAAWPAIGDIVVKGKLAMDWFRVAARRIMKTIDKDSPIVVWDTPSGFPATQAYFDIEIHRINTKLHGATKIRVHTEKDTPNVTQHVSGLAPNFVHSMDASHLHLTTARASREGIGSLAMIHDDYGTHAADSEHLYRLIREEFVNMYENNDPIADFYAAYPCAPTPPVKGTLDIRGVLGSQFFFS